MKNYFSVVFLGGAVLVLTSCVTSGRYKKLEHAKASLQVEADSLATENVSLKSEVDELSTSKEGLAAQNAERLEEVQKLTQEQKQMMAETLRREESYNELVGQLSSEVDQGKLQVRKYKDMLSVDVAEKIFFASGSAKMKKEGQEVLLKVGEALSKFTDKNIRVVGHTDNVPIGRRSPFESNWELSVMRATTVVRFLQEKAHLAPESLIASGQGEYQPIASNDTAEGRQKNRRIEIMLLDKALGDVIEGSTAPK